MQETDRKHELAAFLRTRRERLTPADVGLPSGVRRRTPGLRREEVAQLANVGVAWYTWLEQGRAVRPSEQVVANLARALHLTPEERRHLFVLAQQPLPLHHPGDEEAGPALCQLVHALGTNPAYVMGRRWDLLTWNPAAELVFRFNDIRPPHRRNLLWRLFATPAIPAAHADWEQVLGGLVAQFRADSASYPNDPAFAELIDDLQQVSPTFRRFWERHDVLHIPTCRKVMTHATLGRLTFEMVTLHEQIDSHVRVIAYLATPETAATLAAHLPAG